MEPRIQYAKTKDGVSIAFYTLGEGKPPLVMMPSSVFSNLEAEWRAPERRHWLQSLGEKRQVVKYDGRGSGLSDRDVSDFSLDGWVLDLEAVADHLALDEMALHGGFHSGPAAITYSARHPKRVSHLILHCSSARGSDLDFRERAAFRSLRDANWELYTETIAHAVLGWSAGEPARRAAAALRDSVDRESFAAKLKALSTFDVTDLLPQVRSPTLVLHRRDVALPLMRSAKDLASGIEDARLIIAEGESLAPWLDPAAILTAINEFLSEGEEADTGAERLTADIVHTVLFTDVEGSTALTQRLGDARARELLRGHERIVREALKSHGGAEVKTMGDGFMTSFSSATKALECAIAMQRAFSEWNQGVGAQGLAPLHVRIGLNAGEPIAEDDPDGRSDLFGTAVNEAARITATAEGGEILVSDVVRQLVKGKDFLFADRGETSLKGFDEPVRLFEVRWREDAT